MNELRKMYSRNSVIKKRPENKSNDSCNIDAYSAF